MAKMRVPGVVRLAAWLIITITAFVVFRLRAFSPNASVRIVSTSAGTISFSGATLRWLTNQPFYAPYSCYAQYGTSTKYEKKTPTTNGGILGVTGLSKGTTYHFAITCSNGGGMATSSDATFQTLASLSYNVPRTVIDNEAAILLERQSEKPGLSVGLPYTTVGFTPANIDPLGIKAFHSLFHQYGAPDQHNLAFAPYEEISAFNAGELAAGRSGVLVTARYGNRSYPLYSTADGNDFYNAKQAMFLQDPRYVRFFAQEHARKVLLIPTYPDADVSPYYPYSWTASDEGTFEHSVYSIFPSGTNNPVSPSSWDASFPQNQVEYKNSIASFLYQTHNYAPDVHVMINEGATETTGDPKSRGGDVANWANVFGEFDGTDHEECWYMSRISEYARRGLWNEFLNWSWAASTGRVQFCRVPLGDGAANNNQYQTQTIATGYLIYRDGNTFLGIESARGSVQIPPSTYTEIFDALGSPTGTYTTIQNGSQYYDAVYLRAFQGGIALFNYSGLNFSYRLPPTLNGNPVDGWYLNGAGSPLSPGQTVTIADASSTTSYGGIYLTPQPAPFANIPSLYPPTFGKTLTGPVSVTMTSRTPSASIHYTVDGTVPTCDSLPYSSPVQLTAKATVKAIACASGYIHSFAKSMTYNVTSDRPTVQFGIPADAAPPFYTTVSAPIVLSNPTASTVTVNYTVSGERGTAVSPLRGTVAFRPYEVARAIIINAALKSGSSKTVTIALSDASNADVGAQSTFAYTIAADPVPSLIQFVNLHPIANAELLSTKADTPTDTASHAFYVGTYGPTAGRYRCLWKFALTSIPSNAKIISAHIRGYFGQSTDGGRTGTLSTSVYRMQSDWTQRGATWHNSGGDPTNYAAEASSSADPWMLHQVNNPTNNLDVFWDVTSDVAKMVGNAQPNYGWLMIGPEAPPNTCGATGAGSGSSLCTEDFNTYNNNYVDGFGNHIWGPMVSLLVTYSIPNP